MRKAFAFLMILVLAGAANAATITVSSATPDMTAYSAYGGRLVTELTQYTYHVTKTTETGELNAVEVHVTTTAGNELIHQVYNRSYSSKAGGYTYTDTTKISEIPYPVEAEPDTGLLSDEFTLGVGVDDEDIVNLTEDVVLVSEFVGPTVGPIEVEYYDANYELPTPLASGLQSGYGSYYDFVGAAAAEQADFDLFQLVIPAAYYEVADGGDIVVEIVAATATETTREYFHYVIPEPAVMSLLTLGGLGLACRRRRR